MINIHYVCAPTVSHNLCRLISSDRVRYSPLLSRDSSRLSPPRYHSSTTFQVRVVDRNFLKNCILYRSDDDALRQKESTTTQDMFTSKVGDPRPAAEGGFCLGVASRGSTCPITAH